MRAAILRGHGLISAADVPDPHPTPGEIVIQTIVAGICGSDLERVFGSTELSHYPCSPGAPGHEAVGSVISDPAAQFTPGDLVLAVPSPAHARAFAEIQALPVEAVVAANPAMDPVDLLMAQQLGTVIYALKRFWPGRAGRVAAVYGAGAAGLHFVQLLKRRGFETVIAIDLSAARLNAAEKFGADLTFLATGSDPVAAVMDHTHGVGADLVVEAAGRDQTRLQAMRTVAADGTVGLYGLPEHVDPVPLPLFEIFRRQPAVKISVGAQAEPGLASFRAAVQLISGGLVPVRGLVSHTLDIDDVATAFELARTRRDRALKVCLGFGAPSRGGTTQATPDGSQKRR